MTINCQIQSYVSFKLMIKIYVVLQRSHSVGNMTRNFVDCSFDCPNVKLNSGQRYLKSIINCCFCPFFFRSFRENKQPDERKFVILKTLHVSYLVLRWMMYSKSVLLIQVLVLLYLRMTLYCKHLNIKHVICHY